MPYLPKTLTITILFFILLSSETSADGFYKWVDARGNTQYSDEPPAKGHAKKLSLPPITILENYGKQWQVTPIPPAKRPRANPIKQQTIKKQPQGFQYKALNFIAPKFGQSIKANDGDISAMLNIKPPLRKGHSFIYVLDGKDVSRGVSRIANFQNLQKGSHSLMVKVINSKGKPLQKSREINFTVNR